MKIIAKREAILSPLQSVIGVVERKQTELTALFSVAGGLLATLAGFTGLFSIGHAAFLGVGAYTEAPCRPDAVPEAAGRVRL